MGVQAPGERVGDVPTIADLADQPPVVDPTQKSGPFSRVRDAVAAELTDRDYQIGDSLGRQASLGGPRGYELPRVRDEAELEHLSVRRRGGLPVEDCVHDHPGVGKAPSWRGDR